MGVINNQIPGEIIEKLAQLKEEFRGRAMNEDWRCDWWRRLGLEHRQTLCVLAGVDDSEEFAARRWQAISIDNRDKLCKCARDWARMLGPMRWA